ncbi:hypothetical protein BOTBODRAFT_149253 [Botryobasidium botryosum FD-172 SS1]|uniref:F-box domain-containing protein n=1 Tax=Botryobasidium botryosum (strain FD-172 SS1) TaxID=930990 RepID=A0A067M725_BOTB1|nr:hypothetical protein BOTBODRAFT_149253 [Botryobasidium botryosum FD-172 SS1]
MESIDANITAMAQGLINETMRSLDRVTSADGSTAHKTIPAAALDVADLDKEVRAIESIKAHMEERLREIRHRKNLFAPIHRLPNEIISIVFQCVERRSPPVALQNLLSVSHKWRSIALDTPSLWANLHNLSTPLLDVFITRSKQSLLEISYGTHGEPDDLPGLLRYMARVSPHKHRWKICTFTGPQRAQAEILSQLTAPAPNMEVLAINLYGNDEDAESIDEERGPFNINALFGGSTPRLRELTLGGVLVPLSSSIFSGLTKLELGRISYSSPKSVRLLLRALESCPLLESLTLTDIYVVSLLQINPAPSSVKLTYLQVLEIRQTYWMGWPQYHILDCIVIPPSSLLKLSVATYIPILRDLVSEPLPQINSSYLGLRNISTIKELSIRLKDESHCCTVGHSPDTSKRSFVFDVRTESDAFSYTLATLHPAFPMLLESLVLFSASPHGYLRPIEFNTAVLVNFLNHQPLIRKLTFDHCAISATQVLEITPTQHVCPRLEELHVIDCAMDVRELISLVRPRAKGGVERGARAEDVVYLQRLRVGGYPGAPQLAPLEVPINLDVIFEGEQVSTPEGAWFRM